MNELANVARDITGMLPALARALPFFLAFLVIGKLAFAQIKGIKQPVAPMDAAYTLIALAAFVYAIR